MFRRKQWKIKTISIPIEKEVIRINKNGEELQKKTYMLQFIGSTRFMVSSLSNRVDNLFDIIHRIKCKYGRDDKKY